MQATLDAAALTQMNRRGQTRGASSTAAALGQRREFRGGPDQRIDSPVAGDADMLLVPNIDGGKLVGKVMMYSPAAREPGSSWSEKGHRPDERFDNAETKLFRSPSARSSPCPETIQINPSREVVLYGTASHSYRMVDYAKKIGERRAPQGGHRPGRGPGVLEPRGCPQGRLSPSGSSSGTGTR